MMTSISWNTYSTSPRIWGQVVSLTLACKNSHIMDDKEWRRFLLNFLILLLTKLCIQNNTHNINSQPGSTYFIEIDVVTDHEFEEATVMKLAKQMFIVDHIIYIYNVQWIFTSSMAQYDVHSNTLPITLI